MNEAMNQEDDNITLDQAKALAHWGLFGQVGQVEPGRSSTRVTATSWKNTPKGESKKNKPDHAEESAMAEGSTSTPKVEELMPILKSQPKAASNMNTSIPAPTFKEPRHVPWTIALSATQLSTLLNGFCPRVMDDKLFIYADGPDADGKAKLHMHHSWTGAKSVELDIQMTGDDEDEDVAWTGAITGITFEGKRDADTDENEKEEATETTISNNDYVDVDDGGRGRVAKLDPQPNSNPNKKGIKITTLAQAEEMAKFVAAEGCFWVIGVKFFKESDRLTPDTGSGMAQPSVWDDLPLILPKSKETQTAHRWLSNISKEVLERLMEQGPGSIIQLD